MKTIDIGKYLIRTTSVRNNIIELKKDSLIALYRENICLFDTTLSLTEYDAIFYAHPLENDIEVAVVFDKYARENIQKIFRARVGVPFVISHTECEIFFECRDDNLEIALRAFKENQLVGDYDVKSLLLQYAKKKDITEKQAVCYIVTTIDVPEVEG